MALIIFGMTNLWHYEVFPRTEKSQNRGAMWHSNSFPRGLHKQVVCWHGNNMFHVVVHMVTQHPIGRIVEWHISHPYNGTLQVDQSKTATWWSQLAYDSLIWSNLCGPTKVETMTTYEPHQRFTIPPHIILCIYHLEDIF